MHTTNLIILDRDGVINFDSDNYIRKPEEWQAIPGSLEAIATLCEHNFSVAVCTNQSGLARGFYTETVLSQIHDKMLTAVRELGGDIHRISHCPHLPADKCLCRKPAPGMLLDTLRHFNTAACEAIFVGDSLRDIQAGLAANIEPVLVLTGNGALAKPGVDALGRIPCFSDLAAFTTHLIEGVR